MTYLYYLIVYACLWLSTLAPQLTDDPVLLRAAGFVLWAYMAFLGLALMGIVTQWNDPVKKADLPRPRPLVSLVFFCLSGGLIAALAAMERPLMATTMFVVWVVVYALNAKRRARAT